MKQKPALQFYIQDFLGSSDVQMMSIEEVGSYCLLLFNLFNNGGILPADPEKLKLLCRGCVPSQNVMKKFYAVRIADEDFIRNERIDFEIEKKKKFSNEMRALAGKRWIEDKKGLCVPHSLPHSVPVCLSISSSISKKKEKKKKNKTIPEGETDRGNDIGFDNFLNHCQQRKIKVQILCDKYLELRKEFQDRKIDWNFQIKKCVNWNYDNERFRLGANAIRNWMTKAIEIGKSEETKRLQNYNDKKFVPKESNPVSRPTQLPEVDPKDIVRKETIEKVTKDIAQRFSFPASKPLQNHVDFSEEIN